MNPRIKHGTHIMQTVISVSEQGRFWLGSTLLDSRSTYSPVEFVSAIGKSAKIMVALTARQICGGKASHIKRIECSLSSIDLGVP